MTVEHEERLARLALARVAEPGSRAVHSALQLASAVEVWEAVRAGARIGDLGQRALDGIASRLDGYEPARDLERLEALGGRVLCPGDEEWPDGLDWHPDELGGSARDQAPPWALLVVGRHDLRQAAASAVAVVGSRACTGYGEQVTRELAFALAEAGVAVVSGGAYGIDGAAHRAALDAGGAPTVAVLACGLDVAYPRGNDRLLAQVGEQGLLVSEVPPGSAPTRLRFLVRNRVVAALARGTVVVEAAARSGSLSTAGRAAELGRHVMAVPGPVVSAASTGCHELIRSGAAVLVTDAATVLEQVSLAGENLAPAPRGTVHPRDGLADEVRRVLDAVPVRTAVGVARIARTAGASALLVQQVMPELLLAGLVEQRDGGWRLTALGAGAGPRGAVTGRPG